MPDSGRRKKRFMKMKGKKLLSFALCLFLSVTAFAGCGGGRPGDSAQNSDSVSDSVPAGDSATDSTGGETPSDGYVYDGTPTVAPYVIYNADGTECDNPQVGGNSFESMFEAIRTCGSLATNSNRMYVQDAAGTIIFQRQGNSECWVYDGTNLVSNTMSVNEGTAYAEEHARAYVVNGRGTSYVALGILQYTEGRAGVPELISGGYSYLMTPQGAASGEEWIDYSYAYGSAYIRLSEVTYKDISESGGGQWNAYAFFNIASSAYTCDLGIGSYAGGGGKWLITQNCSHESHDSGTAECEGFYIDAEGNVTYASENASGQQMVQLASSNRFYVWSNYVVTTMTKDPETGIYSGADDLFLEASANENGWYVCVTNLRTGEKWGYTHTHTGMNSTQANYMRVLLAASYCPVEGNVWNARDGGFIKNVVFEDVKVSKYQADGDYSDVERENFYPGEDAFFNGYTQAADCASLLYGITDVAGTWESGNDRLVGSNWYSFSSYYDGTHITEDDKP